MTCCAESPQNAQHRAMQQALPLPRMFRGPRRQLLLSVFSKLTTAVCVPGEHRNRCHLAEGEDQSPTPGACPGRHSAGRPRGCPGGTRRSRQRLRPRSSARAEGDSGRAPLEPDFLRQARERGDRALWFCWNRIIRVSPFSKTRLASCGPRIPGSPLRSLSPRRRNGSSPHLPRRRESQTKRDTPATPSSRPFLHGCGGPRSLTGR